MCCVLGRRFIWTYFLRNLPSETGMLHPYEYYPQPVTLKINDIAVISLRPFVDFALIILLRDVIMYLKPCKSCFFHHMIWEMWKSLVTKHSKHFNPEFLK